MHAVTIPTSLPSRCAGTMPLPSSNRSASQLACFALPLSAIARPKPLPSISASLSKVSGGEKCARAASPASGDIQYCVAATSLLEFAEPAVPPLALFASPVGT